MELQKMICSATSCIHKYINVQLVLIEYVDKKYGGKMRIVAIADRWTSIGFRLAGVVESYACEGKKDVEEKLEKFLSDEDVGIIIITEKIFTKLDWRLKKRIEQTAKPSVVTIPDKGGPSGEVESLKDMVKRALGFELMK